MKYLKKLSLAFAILFMANSYASALETPIGLPQSLYGMEIAAVYLQPIEMEPKGIMASRKDADTHIEADIHATDNNPNGFAGGEWIPFLTVHYTIINLDTKEKIEGMMMPMVANDGPHYGDNVKMPGIGRYKVIYRIDNPGKNKFGRHMDRQTGVRPWFKEFEVEWTFNFLGAGKKGGY